MSETSFEDFREGLQRLGGVVTVEPEMRQRVEAVATSLSALDPADRGALSAWVADHPQEVPILALCVGLTQEMLKNTLKHGLGTASWAKLARTRPSELIELLDGQFGLVAELEAQRSRTWTFADVLVERLASRSRAAGSIGRGRRVEDEVEAVVSDLRLPHVMRTSFTGRGGRIGPCDLSVPRGGDEALIVCAMKGFDSTGSKLSDAVSEIERMADVRLPSQYVYVVLDGIGWLNRQADLRRIFDLRAKQSIDGLYTLSWLALFRDDMRRAARRVGMID